MLDHYIKYHHIHDAVLTHMIRLTNGSPLKQASSYGGQTSSSQVLVDLFDYDCEDENLPRDHFKRNCTKQNSQPGVN